MVGIVAFVFVVLVVVVVVVVMVTGKLYSRFHVRKIELKPCAVERTITAAG